MSGAKAKAGRFTMANAAALAVTVLSFCGAAALAQRAGGSAAGYGLALLCGVLCVPVPAFFAAQVVFKKLAGPAAQAAGLVLAFAVFAGLAVLSSAVGSVWLVRLLPLAAVLGLPVAARRRRGSFAAVLQTLRAYLPLAAVAGVLALISAAGAGLFAHPAAVGQITPSQDFFWNLGNAESFLLGFPPADLRFAGVTLTYHYLTELLAAGLSMASGLAVYDVLAFYQTPLLLALLVWALWQLGQAVFGGSRAKSALLLAATFLLGCVSLYKVWPSGQSRFWNTGIRHLLTNINGQATATLFLCLFVLLFWQLAGQKFRAGAPLWVALVLCFGLLCFAKGPVAGIVAIAAVAAVVWGGLRGGTSRGGALLFVLLVGGGFWLLYRFYFAAGASTSMVFSPAGTLQKSYFANYIALITAKSPLLGKLLLPVFMLLQTFCMAPAGVALYLFALLRDVRRLPRLDVPHLFWHAGAVGGMAAFFLFDHYAMSQIYFGFAGLFFINLLALDALGDAKNWFAKRLPAVRKVAAGTLGVLVAASAATGLLMQAQLAFAGLQVLASPLETAAQSTAQHGTVPLTAAEETGMRWLAAALQPGELFATNRIHTGAAQEGLSNVYSGLSGRGAYMESFKYAVSNMGVAGAQVEERLAVITAIFNADTPHSTVQSLCKAHGIRYLAYCPAFDGATAQFAGFLCVYDSEQLKIYEVPA